MRIYCADTFERCAPNAACCIVQVFGWDIKGTIVFNDVLCKDNGAQISGGCFYGSGKAIFNDGTVMLDNSGANGGSVCERNNPYSLLLSGGDIALTDIDTRYFESTVGRGNGHHQLPVMRR